MTWLTAWSVVKNFNPIKFLQWGIEKRELEQRYSDLEKRLSDSEQEKTGLRTLIEAYAASISRRYSRSGYVLLGDDTIPYCATCLEKDGKQISLTPLEEWNGGMRRSCPVCDREYWDSPPSWEPTVTHYHKTARQRIREFEAAMNR